jgi:hypothetical protein
VDGIDAHEAPGCRANPEPVLLGGDEVVERAAPELVGHAIDVHEE